MTETINDYYLGIIKYDVEYDRYQEKVTNKDGEVIEFSFDIDDNLEEVLRITRKIIKSFDDHFLDFKLYAAEKLLDLYNDTWSDGEAINKNEFANQIILESIVIYSDYSAEFYYLDSGLFAGHSIVIYTNSEFQLEDVYLVG